MADGRKRSWKPSKRHRPGAAGSAIDDSEEGVEMDAVVALGELGALPAGAAPCIPAPPSGAIAGARCSITSAHRVKTRRKSDSHRSSCCKGRSLRSVVQARSKATAMQA